MKYFRLGNRLSYRQLKSDDKETSKGISAKNSSVSKKAKSISKKSPSGKGKVPALYEQQVTPCVPHDHVSRPVADRLPSMLRLRGMRPRPFDARTADVQLKSHGDWNSVALFFNLNVTSSTQPTGYASTSVADAKAFMDEGAGALSPGISESTHEYWRALSYGEFGFGLNTPRNSSGAPLIPQLAVPLGGAKDWGALIRECIKANPVAVWEAAGRLMEGSKRWIPSVALIQNYNVHASATYGGFDLNAGGDTYHIGDITHIQFSLEEWAPPENPSRVGRKWWGTLMHEYAHNFLEFGDLYGPSGCTGYWDILGNSNPPGRYSEVSSVFKERQGWLSFKQVINGPIVSNRSLSLRPYTTTGDAYKVVPDPIHTPHEYFLLEYRQSIGNEVWRPDGALAEEGLLITHINERIGIPNTWLLRDAPYFNPEFPDDGGPNVVDWSGSGDLNGKLFPQGAHNSFTPSTSPSSNLYGPRHSGLSITNIRISGGRVRFNLAMNGSHSIGWTVKSQDRALAGRFTPEAEQSGEEIFIRDNDAAALLTHGEGQWHVEMQHDDWIGDWNMGQGDRETVGDLDGDGMDEILLRSDNWIGVAKWQRGRFRTTTVQHDWVDGWNLGRGDRELVADLDGDGAAEIYIRSNEWAGVMKLDPVRNRIRLSSIQHDWIGEWNLGAGDKEFVGRFRSPDKDDIMIRSAEWMGLLGWNQSRSRLDLVKIQHDWIDGWNMGAGDTHFIGDFDGDGLDEILIRSNEWAGIIKWQRGRFRLVTILKEKIPHMDGEDGKEMPLDSGDLHYTGRFRGDRDGIVLRKNRDRGGEYGKKGLYFLHLNGSNLVWVRRIKSHFNGRWNLGNGDKFVLGDYHRKGPDIADAPTETVSDGLTDIFIHNGWGSGMVGVNFQWDEANDPGVNIQQVGLTWMRAGGFVKL